MRYLEDVDHPAARRGALQRLRPVRRRLPSRRVRAARQARGAGRSRGLHGVRRVRQELRARRRSACAPASVARQASWRASSRGRSRRAAAASPPPQPAEPACAGASIAAALSPCLNRLFPWRPPTLTGKKDRSPLVPTDRTSLTDDERIGNVVPLPPPEHLIQFFPIRGTAAETLISETRRRVREILKGRSDRLLVVIGPCSIHDPAAALEYAERLRRDAPRRRGGPRGRDARLLREAAHHGRLEGPHQRPAPRRQLPHQRGPAHRARPAGADQPGRACPRARSSST